MCRCQSEEADRQREETERAEKRRRTERLRKQCFPSSGRYAFCTFDADDGRNAAQSTVCKAFAATFDPKDPEGLCPVREARHGKSFHASCIANAVIERGFSCRDRYQAGREPDGILLREAFREPLRESSPQTSSSLKTSVPSAPPSTSWSTSTTLSTDATRQGNRW